MTFLNHPKFERVQKYSFRNPLNPLQPMLTIGAQVVTEDNDGLRIIPTIEIVFAIGVVQDQEQSKFGISTSMARDIVKSIIEMCDVIDRGETSIDRISGQ